jgi:hypothetical protein
MSQPPPPPPMAAQKGHRHHPEEEDAATAEAVTTANAVETGIKATEGTIQRRSPVQHSKETRTA